MFGDNGGGFFDNQEKDQKQDNYNNTASKGQDFEKKKTKMFVPLTLKMVNFAECTNDDKFTIEGEEITDVIIIGRLIQKDEMPTRTNFDINDNTGTFRVTFYHREENVLPMCLQNLKYEPDCYVKIFGHLRKFKETRSIVGTHVSKINEYDEITNHFLQVFISSEARTKGVLASEDLEETKTDPKNMSPADRAKFVEETIMEAFGKILADSGKNETTGDQIFTVVKGKDIKHPEFKKVITALADDMKIFSSEENVYSKF
jgi:RPA family protein